MLLALTALGCLLLGFDVSRLLWRAGLRWGERALFSGVIGTAVWLASSWVLGLCGLLNRPAVLTRTALVVVIAITFRTLPRINVRHAFALIPLILWTLFVLIRAALVPPLSHDALSFHLPKAAIYVQEQRYDSLEHLDSVFTPRPSSYELLLADTILLDGADTYTEWLSTVFYLLFIAGAVALAQRWWSTDDPTVATVVALATACVPVLLLHAGAHKNDVMMSAFLIGAAVAGGRWIAQSDSRALILALVALTAAASTKTHALVYAACLAPFLLLGFPRVPRWLPIILALLIVLAVPIAAHDRYGDWQNLWIAPFVLLKQPFTASDWTISVPGHGLWRWPKYELYFSHLGAPFALAAIAMPFLRGKTRECLAITHATFLALLLLLPVRFVPEGLYVLYLPRFILFVVPVVFGWTLPAAALARPRTALITAIVVFAFYAITNGAFDMFQPPKYLQYVWQHPGTRLIAFDPNRPASIVDRAAGPNDTIAFDGAGSAWIYPAYGRALTRRVLLLPPGPLHIPNDARWVVIDRSWHVLWGDPRFRKLSDFQRYLAKGEPAPEDVAVFRQIESDPRFAPVYVNEKMLEGVFVRR